MAWPSGLFDGSYFTGMEGSLRTPCLVRYPGRAPAGRQSNEIVHITDMFTTLVRWGGAEVPQDRVIDGADQRAFLEGKQGAWAREGFPYWIANTLYGVKWLNFKLAMYEQRFLDRSGAKAANSAYYQPDRRSKGAQAVRLPLTCIRGRPLIFGRILKEFAETVKREPLIPAGAKLDHVPTRRA